MTGNNFDFERDMMPQVKELIRRHAGEIVSIEYAGEERDTKQATDLEITVAGGAVGVRVRRYDRRNYRDFTIRCRSRYGGRTEIDKLRDGWGDFYLYAWENTECILDEYMLIDLHILRTAGLLDPARLWFQNLIPNRDPTMFAAIPLHELVVAQCVLAHTVKTLPQPVK